MNPKEIKEIIDRKEFTPLENKNDRMRSFYGWRIKEARQRIKKLEKEKQFEIKEYEEKLKRINWLINLEKETILKDKKSFKKLQKEYFKSLND